MRGATWVISFLAVSVATCVARPAQLAPARDNGSAKAVRVCAADSALSPIDWHLKPSEALAAVDRSLNELEQLVHRAGGSGCDALALPEDTLKVLHWEMGNKALMNEVLPLAVARMLERLGRAAAAHRMYLICSSDVWEHDGSYRNTAFFLDRDGKEIGRYHKVHPTISESDHVRGTTFPVFETSDLGGVGMLICYDMVMPEAARSLALAGADIIFLPTMGGAVTTGDEEMNRAAFRTRAVDNFVYLVVAQRGGGSMIISPQGKVLAEGRRAGDIAIAEIDPLGGREGGDAHNVQRDMRARLFRERNPEAYGILTDPNPPVLSKIPATITAEEAVRIFAGTLTTGEERFAKAESLLRAGKTEAAARVFEELRAEFPRTWIDRSAGERLARIRADAKSQSRSR
jgi:predicted amidohydrolase